MKMMCSFFIFLLCHIAFAKVELLDHQKYSIDFLSKRPQQKGLLLFHALGTGKTYLSIGFAQRFPDKKVIVLLPRFLKSNWVSQIKSFGVKDESRFELISFREAPTKLVNRNLSDYIVIIDEVHKLVERITNSRDKDQSVYGDIYFNIQNSYKVLALTGTPIFTSASNISFIANLVSGENKLPFNQEIFRQKYMSINPFTSLWRGFFSESKLNILFLPIFSVLFSSTLAAATGSGLLLGVAAALGSTSIFITNEIFPAHSVEFRSFDPDKLKDFALNYVSYYTVPSNMKKDFPTQSVSYKKVLYNKLQFDFFLDFVDESLSPEQIKKITLDEEKNVSMNHIDINSYSIQRDLLLNVSSGRDIGNYSLKSDSGELREAPKFIEILDLINKNKQQVAIYSNYYNNGILEFAKFLDRNKYKDSYVILDPEKTVEEQISILESYNSKQKQIILIHPEITEGISLKATEQLHILEPIENIALQEQIIGRVVRFKSHEDLPLEKRHVNIYIWESYVKYCSIDLGVVCVPSKASFIKREHWHKRFSEINPSSWTYGITLVDKNHYRKEMTPDSRIMKNKSTLERDMKSFVNLVKEFSIEKNISVQ